MSLTDTIFILIGALVLFGPKKLPELARQLGKIMGELRRASNEFKFQMEEELRVNDEKDRREKLANPSLMVPRPPDSGAPVPNKISPRAMSDHPASDLDVSPAPDAQTAKTGQFEEFAPLPQTEAPAPPEVLEAAPHA